MTKAQTTRVREWQGTVVSDKADKTIIVAVERFVTHPKYRKKYRVTKKYAVHDPDNRFSEGDVVRFVCTQPISKRKKFIVVD